MPTTPINGLPSPDDNSPNDPPIHFDALNAVLDSRLVPRYATAAARNSAITSPISGQLCTVAGQLFIYSKSAWRPLVSYDPISVAGNATSWPDNTQDSWGLLNIPDPGIGPYRIYVSAQVRSFATNCTMESRLRAGAQGDPNTLNIVSATANFGLTTGLDLIHLERPSQIINGPGMIVGHAVRIAGTGSWAVTNPVSFTYRIVPA